MPCNSDIIQPDLSMHFHPNLDELMDLDPIAPIQVGVDPKPWRTYDPKLFVNVF